jgi:chaperonin cofactor prefoldin
MKKQKLEVMIEVLQLRVKSILSDVRSLDKEIKKIQEMLNEDNNE